MLDSLVTDWSRERPDLAVAHKEVVYAIHIARSLFTRNADEVLKPWKLNFNSYGVLATLRRSGKPYSQLPGELSKALGFTSGGMSNLLRRLEKLKYIKRVPNVDDERSILVNLTPLGKRTVDQAVTALAESETKHLAALSSRDRRLLYNSLRVVIDSFDEF